MSLQEYKYKKYVEEMTEKQKEKEEAKKKTNLRNTL
jgi:ribosomal protein S21